MTRKPSLKLNVAANFAGKGWSVFMSIAFVPAYIGSMGAENYGLVGVFLMLSSLSNVLDFGLSTTLNRELARRSPPLSSAGNVKGLVRTFELPYWGIGLAFAVALVGLSSTIAGRWLHPVGLTRESVEVALQLIAVALAAQWPSGLYSAGLMGLERQVVLNGILAAFATARGIGSLFVLWWISPTAEAFFVWQAIVNILQTLTVAGVLWATIAQESGTASFDISLLRSTWRFTAGLAVISILGALVTQVDKLILLPLLTLDQFGYYSLAWLIANATLYVVSPISNATFPRLSRIAASDAPGDAVTVYHAACQTVALLIIPLMTIIFFFAEPLLLAWTSNEALASATAPILCILLAGTLLNAVIQIPFQMQYASGRIALGMWANVVALIVVAPTTYLLTQRFGATGAAFGWVLLNLGYMAAAMPLVHRHILDGEGWKWFIQDVMRPLIVCSLVVYLGTCLMPILRASVQVVYIAAVGCAAFAITTLSLPAVRKEMSRLVRTAVN